MSKRSITFKTLDVTVEYEYIPGEPPDKYDGDMAGYPGIDSKLEISSVYIRLRKAILPLTSFFEESGLIYKLEEQLKKELDEEDD
jgi:hypothetical protein